MPDPVSFTSTSPRHALPFLFAGQAQKEFTVNEAHARIDALLHPAIEGVADDPPGSPGEGECWLVGSSPTGEWLDHEGELACHEAGNWIFLVPRDGLHLLDRSTGQSMLYRAGWTMAVAPAAPTGGAIVDAEARTAIAELIDALADAGILPA
jgi:hypothetical protein